MSLRVESLAVDVAGRRVVDGVDLDVPDGAMVGLLGPNGSGKSTLLKVVYRVNRPAAGRVLLDGEDLLAMRPRAAARRVAVLTQDAHVELPTTALDLVLLGRTPHQRLLAGDTARDRDLALDALAQVDCLDLADRDVRTLSGGERQRVQVARVVAQGADHLVLDEPTNHLDIRHQVEVLALVRRLGLTVLTALHDLSLAALHCDRLVVLAGGRVVAAGTPAEVITPETVRAAYGAEVLVVQHPRTGDPQVLATGPAEPHAPAPATEGPP